LKNKNFIVEGHEIKLSSLDKVLFPDDGITKAEVIEYYARIAEYMVPHTMDRPISMQRFPHGIAEKGFYQKEASDYFPEYIQRVKVKLREDNVIRIYPCINNAATLVYLANQGVITMHLWLSRRDKLEYPDKIIFDLDPADEKDFREVVKTATDLRRYCEDNEMQAFPMTTGSKGIHVVVPILREMKFDKVKERARAMAEEMVRRFPDHLTMEIRKEKRKGRIFMDILRNEYGQTGVAPYSIRPRAGAPVATPLSWDEVNNKLHPRKYTLKNIFRRLSKKGDPWTGS
jgi:bifunctional non-homologous end joining protein LigD